MPIRQMIRKLLRKAGYDIFRLDLLPNPMVRWKKRFEFYHIDLVLDVGANTGQFAQYLRNGVGYSGRIISFEPLGGAFRVLRETAAGDPRWAVMNCALGETAANAEINVAGNSFSSSLLPMLPAHDNSAPESTYIGREWIQVKTLDSLFETFVRPSDHIYLKIDTQGYESHVLRGAENSLARIDTIQLEMSFVPLYQGQLLFPDMHALLQSYGYTLVDIEPEFSDPRTRELLQVNGLFHRKLTRSH